MNICQQPRKKLYFHSRCVFLIARQEGPIKRQPHITSWKAIPGKQSGQVFTFYKNRVGIQDTIELLREYEPSVYREMLT